MSPHYEELTGREIATAISSSSILPPPIGAVEQHGPHLPLSVGYIGDPTGANAELGQALFDGAVAELSEAMAEVRSFDFGR